MARRSLDDLLERLDRLPRPSPLAPTLIGAARAGDLAMVELFLQRGARLDERAVGFQSPLAAAAGAGQAAVVERLLEAGASPASRDAASSAVRAGESGILERLFIAGLSPQDREATAALVWAAVVGRSSAFRLLSARGVLLSESDHAWALSEATRNGHRELAAFLRGELVDLSAVPETPRSARSGQEPDPVAIATSRAELGAQLLAALAAGELDGVWRDVDLRGCSLLTAVISSGCEEAALALIARAAHFEGAVTWAGRDADPPLVAAAASGSSRVVAALLAAGAGADRPALDAALLEAAYHGLPEPFELLLAAGANPRAKSEGGETAMTRASGPFRDELRRRLRAAASTECVDAPRGLVTTGRPAAEVLPERGGAADFVRFLENRHPEWEILAVAAPIERVTVALAVARRALRVHEDVARRAPNEVGHGVFVVQFVGHAWTLELRALGCRARDGERDEGIDQQAARLSRELAVDALSFIGSDAAAAHAVTRFVDGRRVETVDSSVQGNAAVESLLARVALRVPPMVHQGDGFFAQLALHRLKAAAVRRLDYLVLSDE
jgi:hypothetical protein